MPSARRQKSKAKTASRPVSSPRKSAKKAPAHRVAKKASAPKSSHKAGASATAKPSAKSKPAPAAAIPVVRRADGRTHVLSLSFVRDGDEFLARMETDAGQITELKNRSLDQLLTLVASELEDLLE
ncbi:MAG: hypothetical protein WA691_01735 [Thermoplasmata archaeon]